MIKTTVKWTNGQPHSAPQLICDGCGRPVHPQEGICFCYPAGTDLYIVHQGVCARTLAAILRPDDRPRTGCLSSTPCARSWPPVGLKYMIQ